MYVRHPVWLTRVRSAGAEAFAILFAIESLARAVLTAVIPLQALAILGDAQRVSMLFFCVSLVGLGVSLTVPWWIRRLGRRWVYTGGALLLIGASAALASDSLGGQLAGMILRVAAAIALSVCLNLYIMDHIDRRQFNRSEPMRLFYSAGAWTIGPALGVYLGSRVAPWTPFALSAGCAAILLGYFWYLRMTENFALSRPLGPAPGPLRNIRRYFAQPRLGHAWLMSVGRNAWWVMFFIYVPIYAVEAGLGPVVGGLIVSAGTGFLFLMPLFGWWGRRFGLRRLFIWGFGAAGFLTVIAGSAGMAPWIVAALLVAAAFCMVALDASGNTLFLRAVRPRERPEMTTVYSTYRDAAEIGPPGVFSLLLRSWDLSAVFLVSGVTTLGLVWLGRAINRRL